MRNPFRDSYGDISLLSYLVLLIGGVLAFCVVIGVLSIATERHFGRISCRTFSEQTDRQTKFVVYNWANGGDCLTPDGSGKWIPTNNLREFAQ